MLSVVNLNDEQRLQAGKVWDTGTDPDLSAESMSIELLETQVLP